MTGCLLYLVVCLSMEESYTLLIHYFLWWNQKHTSMFQMIKYPLVCCLLWEKNIFPGGIGGGRKFFGNSRGVGGLPLLPQNGKSEGVGGSYMKFPPWWGYGYFLEIHNIQKSFDCTSAYQTKANSHCTQHPISKMTKKIKEAFNCWLELWNFCWPTL